MGSNEKHKKKKTSNIYSPEYVSNLYESMLRHMQANIDEETRRLNYSLTVLFGPIFICSCCESRLYEKSVTKITPNFKEKVNKRRHNFY